MEGVEQAPDSVIQLSGYPDRPVYNTKAVSVRTGVPADTFRAWERRYGVPKPYRTKDAQRLYSERDVAAINWLKRQTDIGLTISQAVALLCADSQVMPTSVLQPASTEEAARQLFTHLVGLDSPQAERLLTRCLDKFGVEATCISVLEPMMYRVGKEWAEGTVPVSVEHFVTFFVRSRLTGLVNISAQNASLGPVLTACAPGETHEIGLLMLNLFLLRRGVKVIHLGANLPLDELARMAQRTHPRLICLSASTRENAEALVESVHSLGGLDGLAPRIGCGGYAFRTCPELRAQVESFWLGSNAAEASDTIRGLLTTD